MKQAKKYCLNRGSGVYSHDVTAIVAKQMVLQPPLPQASARHCLYEEKNFSTSIFLSTRLQDFPWSLAERCSYSLEFKKKLLKLWKTLKSVFVLLYSFWEQFVSFREFKILKTRNWTPPRMFPGKSYKLSDKFQIIAVITQLL